MPLIPAYGNLDDAPDGIYSASKRLSRIALDNIRPPDGVDMEYARELKADASINASYAEFENLIHEFYNQYELMINFPPPANDQEAYEMLTILKVANNILRKATLVFTSKIKSKVTMLSKKNVASLKEVQYWLNLYLDNLNFKLLKRVFAGLDFGMISFDLFNSNMIELIQQIAISLNTFNQNSAGVIGYSTQPQEITMNGGSRNFYGKKINNSPDVPTIYSDFVKNCPTKFLL